MKKEFFLILLISLFIVGCNNSSQEQSSQNTEQTSVNTEQHTHNFSENWIYDKQYHWHACNICDEIKDKTVHSYNAPEILVEPTEDHNGIEVRICSICKYRKERELVYLKTSTTDETIFSHKLIKINYNAGDFYIGSTEVTYKEWYDVWTWGEQHGYLFANYGREGSNGYDDREYPETPKGSSQPVVSIFYRDIIVWLNAASEKAGLTPVYMYNGEVIKIAEILPYSTYFIGTNQKNNIWCAKDRQGRSTKCTINKNANGYRLPTNDEWDFAARGGKSDFGITNNKKEILDAIAWYKGNSDGHTHDVATQEPNEYGLYDTIGNVWEYTEGYKIGQNNDYFVTNIKGWYFDKDWYEITMPPEKGEVTSGDCNATISQGFRVCRSCFD
nr:SUMF1/EgtB/PvdO family nonheme iron enzyme [Treponema sp.]